MMPSRRSSTSLRVCLNHRVVHTIQDYPALASRARYFVSIDDLMPDGTNYLDLDAGAPTTTNNNDSLRPRSHSADLVAAAGATASGIPHEEFLHHHIPACIAPSTVSAFLKALEHDSFAVDYWGTTDKEAPAFGSLGADRRFAFYALWLFFGCQPSLLRNFVQSLSIYQRAELIQYAALVATNDNASEPLINLSPLLENVGEFWNGATQLDIPLHKTLAELDLKVALLLLQAHAQANPHDWLSPVKQAGFLWQNARQRQASARQSSGGKNKNKQPPQQSPRQTNSPQAPPQRLSPRAFAIVLLQSHVTDAASAASPLWTRQNLELVFGYFWPDSDGNKPLMLDGQPALKPQGLEALLCRALMLEDDDEPPLTIPQALRQWDLDEALLAPTLMETHQLTLAVQYPRPQRIVETVVHNWTPQQCAQALQEDTGGLASLLDVLDNDDPKADHGAWLAQIPVLVQTRNALDGGMVQAVLYRLLFWHVPFDATLPPELLGTALPIADGSATPVADRKKQDPKKKKDDKVDLSRNYGVWALDHATRYLEAGIDSEVFCKLPWKAYANGVLLGRVVRALHAMEQQQQEQNNGEQQQRSPLWECVELDKLSVTDLEYVPPQRLAVYAVRGQRQDQTHVQDLQATVATLQAQLQTATETIQRLETETQKREKAQASKLRALEQSVKRLQTETKQLKRDQGRLQKRESAMKKMMETQTGQQVVG